ncbi:MAG: copper-binding protein [Burkholderiales bacterium]|nr:copper-binding protein [Burkholderiales bacterium]
MKTTLCLALVLISMAAPAQAQQRKDEHSGHHPAATATAATEMTDGEVRKVDAEAAKVTLKHAEIKNLDMPAMTMVFVVRDKVMLAKVKAGDKVKFRAVNEDGKLTVTELEVVR